MERCWSWLSSVMPRRSSSIPKSLLAVLLIYSLSSQFLPIEPYLVPYLINVKHFTNYQVTVDIFPISIYAQLVFTLLLAPACYYLSHKVVLTLGAFGVLLTYCIVWGGKSLLAMQIMQQGWQCILRETWSTQTLQILSLWWAIAFAGFSLVQNYGTNLFDAVDSKSKLNGHILAIAQAAGSLGSYCAVYIENVASRSGLFIYVVGSALMGVICLSMGVFVKIWATYLLYVTISGIYQTLACLVSVRCSRLLSNGQFILLFSVNNFAGLLIEALLQAAVEALGFSIFAQFVFFAGFFFLSTVIFIAFCFTDNGNRPTLYSVLEGESSSTSDVM